MLLLFWIVFSVPVLSLIESIGGGQVGGGWEEVGVGGKPKAGQSKYSDSKDSAVPLVCDTIQWVGQDCR